MESQPARSHRKLKKNYFPSLHREPLSRNSQPLFSPSPSSLRDLHHGWICTARHGNCIDGNEGWATLRRASPPWHHPDPLVLHRGRCEVHDVFAAAVAAGDEDAAPRGRSPSIGTCSGGSGHRTVPRSTTGPTSPCSASGMSPWGKSSAFLFVLNPVDNLMLRSSIAVAACKTTIESTT
jgi:hypothetical protein